MPLPDRRVTWHGDWLCLMSKSQDSHREHREHREEIFERGAGADRGVCITETTNEFFSVFSVAEMTSPSHRVEFPEQLLRHAKRVHRRGHAAVDGRVQQNFADLIAREAVDQRAT